MIDRTTPTQPRLRPIPTQEFAESCPTSIARMQATRRGAGARDRFYEREGKSPPAVFAQSRAPFALKTSIRIRSVPGNGLACVTASQKRRLAARMTTARPCGCIVRNPERGLSAHGGELMQRSWMIVAAMAASVAACGPNTSQQPARFGHGEEQRATDERRCCAGRLAADQPHARRESLFTVDRYQCGQREKS